MTDLGVGKEKRAAATAQARKKEIPGGKDRKNSKGRSFDAKGAKGATFRHVKPATEGEMTGGELR